MSSTEERIEVLESRAGTAPRINDCIFCHLDPYGHNDTIFHKITDNAVREFLNKNGISLCNHEKAGSWTIQFSDFLNGCLIEELFDTDLKKQNDYDFNYSLFHNERVMIPRIEAEAERKIKVLTENVLGLIPEEREDERAYWQGRIAVIPVFVRLAKQLYEKIYE